VLYNVPENGIPITFQHNIVEFVLNTDCFIPETYLDQSLGLVFTLFVIGTTLHICMSALPFGYVFSLLLAKKTIMFTVLCRHAHSD